MSTSRDARPQSQHYVPVFYLKSWRDVDRELWVYERTEAGIVESRSTPKKTGCHDWLYSFGQELPWEPVIEPDVIETKHFRKLDHAASGIHRLLLTRAIRTMSNSQKKTWARFAVSLVERSLRRLKTNDQLAHDMAANRIEFIRANSGNPQPWDNYVKNVNLEQVARATVRRGMLQIIQSGEVRRALCNKTWLVFGFDQDTLVTSDEPVQLNFGAKADWIQTLSLALDPRHLFMMVPKGTGEAVANHSIDFAAAYVNATMFSKAKYIYSHRKLGDWYPLLRDGLDKYFGTAQHPGFTHITVKPPGA